MRETAISRQSGDGDPRVRRRTPPATSFRGTTSGPQRRWQPPHRITAGRVSCSSISETIIGGTTDGAGNVISGNGFAGIDLGDSAEGTVIQGFYIGTDVTGSVATGNDLGMFVNFSADNVIGRHG